MILTGTRNIGGGKKETIFAQCECTHPEHYVEFGWFKDDTITEWPELYVEVGMAKLPFFKRLWHGVKYILGHRSNYIGGCFEESVLDLEDTEKLVEFLIRARDDMRNESERHAESLLDKKEKNDV